MKFQKILVAVLICVMLILPSAALANVAADSGGGFPLTAAQTIMVVTLLLMLSGKVPIYLTAAVGSIIAAITAGFPLAASTSNWNVVFPLIVPAAPAGEPAVVTVGSLLIGSMHPVILDMMGVLLFIGVMEKAGFLNAIIIKVMQFGERVGRGPGVATAGGVAAGIIGGMTGFTQPAITAVITAPPAVAMGVDKDKVAGVIAHAGHLGNFGGFTHPTLVNVVAMAGIGFGAINGIGAIVALSIFAASYIRLTRQMKKEFGDAVVSGSGEQHIVDDTGISFGKAIAPFCVLLVGLIIGYPIIVVGITAALLVVMMTTWDFIAGEKAMLEGLTRVTVPLLATIAFMFMSAVIARVGLVAVLNSYLGEYLQAQPILIMLLIGSVAGFITQSNGASWPIIMPFLAAILEIPGVHPLVAAVAAAGGPAIMQYYLTGGPVAALATVIPVIPGSDLKAANKFQRPSIVVGMVALFVITYILKFILM